MKIATTIEDFYDYSKDPIKCIEWASKCGFKYIDYSFYFLENIIGTPLETDNYKEYLDVIISKCNELGVKFVQAHAPSCPYNAEGETLENYFKVLRRVIECCSYLKIENLVVHSLLKRGISKEETFRLNKEFYLSFLDYAESLGVKILTENFNKCVDPNSFYYIDNSCDLVEFVEYVNHPNLFVCYDIGHANMQETPQDEQIKTLGKHIKALHVQDNNKLVDYHVAPFFGTTNYDSVMDGLKEIGYNGYFTLEANCFFMRKEFRTRYGENKLFTVPLEIKLEAEKLLYSIAKHILISYNAFEE